MSIIRQRKKNIIISFVAGLCVASLIIAGVAFYFSDPIKAYLTSALEPPAESPVTTERFVATRPIAAGKLIVKDDYSLKTVDLDGSVKDYYGGKADFEGMISTIDIDAGMPLTPPMFTNRQSVEPGLRLYEVAFIDLPYLLQVGDVVDIRIGFLSGEEYVVLVGKEVRAISRSTDNIHKGLLELLLTHEEAMRLSSAYVDTLFAKGSRLYTAKYMDFKLQEPAQMTYPVNPSVLALLQRDPNVIFDATQLTLQIGRGAIVTNYALDINLEDMGDYSLKTGPDSYEVQDLSVGPSQSSQGAEGNEATSTMETGSKPETDEAAGKDFTNQSESKEKDTSIGF